MWGSLDHVVRPWLKKNKQKQNNPLGTRDGSTIKSTGCSLRGPRFIPSSHMMVHNYLYTRVLVQCSLLASEVPGIHLYTAGAELAGAWGCSPYEAAYLKPQVIPSEPHKPGSQHSERITSLMPAWNKDLVLTPSAAAVAAAYVGL